MLNTTNMSRADKTNGCAVTYRSGAGTMFGTCPSTCPLNPVPADGTQLIDDDYLDALLGAVPKRGVAFTYCHFDWRQWGAAWLEHNTHNPRATTVINYSADTERDAAAAVEAGIPCVMAASPEHIAGRKAWRGDDGTRYVQCPAVTGDTDCSRCGGGRPLCARPERDYVVVFAAHGTSKAQVGSVAAGGCYASGGNVALHWRRLAKREKRADSDGVQLRAWVRTLKPGTILRHHVAGDIGLQLHA